MSGERVRAVRQGTYPETDWTAWVAEIVAADPGGCARLYRSINATGRWRVALRVEPQDIDDAVQEIFIRTIEALRRRGLRRTDALMGLVRTITGRVIAQYVGGAVEKRRRLPPEVFEEDDVFVAAGFEMLLKRMPDRRANPEQALAAKEQAAQTQLALSDLPPHYADVLRRFYLCEQTVAQIQSEMHLDDTQFRLLKSRAKARFGAAARARLQPKAKRIGAAA